MSKTSSLKPANPIRRGSCFQIQVPPNHLWIVITCPSPPTLEFLIPTVFRDDYLGALRALSRRGEPAACLRMIGRAQRFSASVDFSDFASARRALEAANAFKEPGEGLLAISETGHGEV